MTNCRTEHFVNMRFTAFSSKQFRKKTNVFHLVENDLRRTRSKIKLNLPGSRRTHVSSVDRYASIFFNFCSFFKINLLAFTLIMHM